MRRLSLLAIWFLKCFAVVVCVSFAFGAEPMPVGEFGFGTVRTAVWSADGAFIMTGGDGGACLWSAADGTVLARGDYPGHRVCSAAFLTDSKRVVTDGPDGIAVWSVPDLKLLQRVDKSLDYRRWPSDFSPSIALSEDGQRLLVRTAMSGLDLYRTDDWTMVDSLKVSSGFALSFAANANLSRVACVNDNGDTGLMKVYDVVSGAEVWGFTNRSDNANVVAANVEGTVLAVGLRQSQGVFLHYFSGPRIGELLGTVGDVVALAFSRNCTRLASV